MIIEEYLTFIWIISGIASWIVIAVSISTKTIIKIGEDGNAALALIIMIIMGPLSILLAIIYLLADHKKETTINNMSEEAAWKKAYKEYDKHRPVRISDNYYHSPRDEYEKQVRDGVEKPKKFKLIFHGACLDCSLQSKSVKECFTCQMYPGNWNTYPDKSRE